MSDNPRVTLDVHAEPSGFDEVRRDINSLNDAADNSPKKISLEDAYEAARKEAEKLQRQARLDQVTLSVVKVKGSVDDLAKALREAGAETAEIARAVRDYGKLEAAIERAAQEQARMNDEFRQAEELNDLVRQRIGITGDIDTALQTIAGGAGRFFGEGAATEVIGAAGEVFAVGEGLGQLSVAAKTVTPAIKAVVESLGAGGVGLVGATIALGAAYALAQKGQERYREAIEAELDAKLRIAQELGGLTQAEIAERRSEAIASRNVLFEQLDAINKELSEIDPDFGRQAEGPLGSIGEAAVGFFRDVAAEVGATADNSETRARIKALRDQVTDLNTQLADANTAVDEYTRAYDPLLEAQEAEIARLAELEEAHRSFEAGLAARNVSRLREQIDALSEAEELIATGSAQQIDERMQGLRNEIAATEEYIAQLEALQAETYEGSVAYETYRDALVAADGQLATLTATYETLDGALDGVIQAREAEAAAALLQAKQIAALVDEIDASIARDLKFEGLFDSATADSLRARSTQLEREREIIEGYLPTLRAKALLDGEAAQALERYNERIAAINDELGAISTQGVTSVRESVFASLQTDIAAINDNYLQTISQINTNLAAAIRAANTALQKALTAATQRRDTELAKAEQDATRARVTAATEQTDALIALEKETARERRNIVEQAGRDINNAIANRDALAAFLAEQRKDDELDELDEREEEKREAIRDSYEKQIKDIADKLSEQRQTILARYEEQRRDAQNAYTQQVQAARDKAAQETQVAQAAKQQAVSIRQAQAQEELAILEQLKNNSLSVFTQLASGAAASLQSIVGGASVASTNLANPNLPSYSVINQSTFSPSFSLQSSVNLASQAATTVFDIISNANNILNI